MLETVVRLTLLGLLFAGLFALWFWSQRRGKGPGHAPANPSGQLRISQKKWIDQRTGVCQVQSGGQTFLLAYTTGSVSWQPLAQASISEEKVDAHFDAILPDEMPVETGRS